MSGPKRPHDHVTLKNMYDDWHKCLSAPIGFKGFGLPQEKLTTTADIEFEGVNYTVRIFVTRCLTDPPCVGRALMGPLTSLTLSHQRSLRALGAVQLRVGPMPTPFNSLAVAEDGVLVGCCCTHNSQLTHGAVVIAAITSCTNTSNPAVMLGAGLVARNAVKRGLKVAPWIKTSLAPGSAAVTKYLANSGLQADLDALGFNLVREHCWLWGAATLQMVR